jgi:hypothetical protein
MKNLKEAIRDLEHIIDSGVTEFKLPVIKGGSVRIGKVIVRPSKSLGYLVVDTETNKTVESAFTKRGAIAIAKAYLKKIPYHSLQHQDHIIEKHTNDSVFYSASIDSAMDDFRKHVLASRLEIATQKIEIAKQHLDRFIFDNIR